MTKFKLGLIVGSYRRQSINRALAQALGLLGAERFEASTSLTARHSSGTCRLPGNTAVPSCALRMVIYLASVFIRNQ